MELRTAINVVIIVVSAAVAMIVGDILGNRVGRVRFAVVLGILILVAFVAFGIYAAVVLMGS